MTARRTGAAAVAAAWSRLAWRTGETILASSEVIARRTTAAWMAGATPDARDRAENARMVQEKWEASAECASSVAATLLGQAMQGSGQWWLDAWRLQLGLASLATSATPAQARARLARVAASAVPMMNRAAVDALARSSAALAPVHRRTGANVRRLRRRAR